MLAAAYNKTYKLLVHIEINFNGNRKNKIFSFIAIAFNKFIARYKAKAYHVGNSVGAF